MLQTYSAVGYNTLNNEKIYSTARQLFAEDENECLWLIISLKKAKLLPPIKYEVYKEVYALQDGELRYIGEGKHIFNYYIMDKRHKAMLAELKKKGMVYSEQRSKDK